MDDDDWVTFQPQSQTTTTITCVKFTYQRRAVSYSRRVSLKLIVELTTNLLLADMVVHPPRLVATEALVGMEAAGASFKTSPLDDHVSSETLPTDDVAEAVAA